MNVWQGISLTTALGLLFYARTLRFGLVVDDIDRLNKGPLKTPIDLLNFFRGSNAVKVPWEIDHAVSLAIHLIVCALLSLYTRWEVGLLFCFHPATLQVSTWLNGKRYGIALFIALLAAHTKFLPIALLSPFWQYGGAPSVLYTRFWDIRSLLIALLASYLFRKGWYAVWYRMKKRAQQFTFHPARRGYIPGKWRLWVKIYGTYFWGGLIPNTPAFFYPEFDQYTLSKKDDDEAFSVNWTFWRGLAAVVATGLCLYLPQTRPGILWFLAYIAMWLHIGPHLTQAYADRYLYFALPGLMMIVFQTPLWPLLLGYYAAMTWVGGQQYKAMEGFLNYNEAIYPMARRAIYAHAYILYKSKAFAGALFKCQIGLQRRPHDYDLRILLGAIYRATGQIDLAKRAFEDAKNYVQPYDPVKQIEQCDKQIRICEGLLNRK